MRTPRLPGRQPSPDGRTDLTLITGDQAQPVPQEAAGSTPAAPAGEMPHAAPALTALPSTTLNPPPCPPPSISPKPTGAAGGFRGP